MKVKIQYLKQDTDGKLCHAGWGEEYEIPFEYHVFPSGVKGIGKKKHNKIHKFLKEKYGIKDIFSIHFIDESNGQHSLNFLPFPQKM